MNESPATWTSQVLLAGSFLAAIGFGIGFALGFVGLTDAGAVLSRGAVITLLLTPVLGLISSAAELRARQRPATVMAAGVLVVLAVAVTVAVFAR